MGTVGGMPTATYLWWCLVDAESLRAHATYCARDSHRRLHSWNLLYLLLPPVQGSCLYFFGGGTA